MEVESYEHGVPSWIDHSSPDPDKSAEFYGALFGWDIEKGPPEAGGYSMASRKGRNVAGIGPQPMPGPPAWNTYVNVDSADDVAARVQANGGRVLMAPMDVFDAGRLAVFVDPGGAVFGVWQPGVHKGAGLVNEEGTFGWSELVTADQEAALAFYAAVFGWEPSTLPPSPEFGPPGGYTLWKVGGREIGGMMGKPPGEPAEVPAYWNVYFVVSDTDETVARAQELGGRLAFGPFDSPEGRIAVIADPAGARFSVISRPGAAAE
jgi:predicted enzyme related to lactoylglutathione lyase